jgi:hypothetical protein
MEHAARFNDVEGASKTAQIENVGLRILNVAQAQRMGHAPGISKAAHAQINGKHRGTTVPTICAYCSSNSGIRRKAPVNCSAASESRPVATSAHPSSLRAFASRGAAATFIAIGLQWIGASLLRSS